MEAVSPVQYRRLSRFPLSPLSRKEWSRYSAPDAVFSSLSGRLLPAGLHSERSPAVPDETRSEFQKSRALECGFQLGRGRIQIHLASFHGCGSIFLKDTRTRASTPPRSGRVSAWQIGRPFPSWISWIPLSQRKQKPLRSSSILLTRHSLCRLIQIQLG